MAIVDDDGKRAALGRQDLGRPAGARALGHPAATSSAPSRRWSSSTADGWFPTGDVATIDADGFMQITDRSKDVIKSGGEWISSIDLENIAMAHPAVREAAAIACRHPKWDERPLLVVVKKPGAELTRERAAGLLRRQDRQVADARRRRLRRPRSRTRATGKMQKLKLREQFKDHRLPGA